MPKIKSKSAKTSGSLISSPKAFGANKFKLLTIIGIVVVLGVVVIKLTSHASTGPHTVSKCPNTKPTLRLTSPYTKSTCVTYLQYALDTSAGGLHGLNQDGSFGPATQAAVKSFQSKHSLSVDGVVGSQTWGKLESLVPPTPGVYATAYSASFVNLKACSVDGIHHTVGPNYAYNHVQFLYTTPLGGVRAILKDRNGVVMRTWPANTATVIPNLEPSQPLIIGNTITANGQLIESDSSLWSLGDGIPAC